jgi:hypothetical protein
MASEQKPLIVQVLFVQNAKAVVFDKGTLTLKGVSPMTIYFSDRPVRIAGHFNTRDEFVPLWDEGKDSFLKDPPNATVSMYEKGKDQLVDVVTTLSEPRLKGDDLTYDIAVIEGKVPKKGGACSVFIDIIGLPFTPLSFAGVARRTMYRTVMWGSAATSAAGGEAGHDGHRVSAHAEGRELQQGFVESAVTIMGPSIRKRQVEGERP